MTDHESPDPFDNDPVVESSKHRRLIRATRQLADLLNEAKPLVELLNSPETTHPYRSTLRELVGREEYFHLTNSLASDVLDGGLGAVALEGDTSQAPPPYLPTPVISAGGRHFIAVPPSASTDDVCPDQSGAIQTLDERSTCMQLALTRFPRWRELLAMLVALIAVVLLSSCGSNSSPATTLAEHQRILASCDQAHPPASWIGIDGSGSSAAENIVKERMAAIESIVRETAVCSGYLKVIVFSSSSTATTTLFDGSLQQRGATANAQLRRVPKAVDATMAAIREAYGPAVAGLDQRSSDITGQYRLAGEWLRQLGSNYTLHLILLSDGFHNEGVDLATQALDSQQAKALAEQVPVPQLPGATVVVAGLGRVAGPPPPSNIVEGLVAYYDALCHRTAAQSCLSVSDYQAAGR